MPLPPSDISYLSHLMLTHAGITLTATPTDLARPLTRLARRLLLPSPAALIRAARATPAGDVEQALIESLLPTETSFFRDPRAFEALQATILPDLLARRAPTRSLSIWCAAASSGQEPYSILLAALDAAPQLFDGSWNLTFLATDISPAQIARAQAGRYTRHEVNRGLPAHLLVQHFSQHGPDYLLHERLRHKITFRAHNLLAAPPFPPASVDLLFLRNTLPHLAPPLAQSILAQARQTLREDGTLYLGTTDYPIAPQSLLSPIAPTAFHPHLPPTPRLAA